MLPVQPDMRGIIKRAFGLVLVLWMGSLLMAIFWTNAAQFGEVFDALSALFAGLAFAGVVITLYYQNQEILRHGEEQKASEKAIAQQLSALQGQVEALHAQANLIAAQTEALTRPYVTISTGMDSGSRVHLIIKNTGRTGAERLSLKIDRPLSPLPSHYTDKYDLSRHHLFTQEYGTLGPESSIRVALGWVMNHLNNGDSEQDPPPRWTITASYCYGGGRLVTEESIIDLRQYNNRIMEHDYHLEELKKLAKSGEVAAESLRSMSETVYDLLHEDEMDDSTDGSEVLP